MKELADKIILALDVPTLEEAEYLVDMTKGMVGSYKIGLELFCSRGAAAIERIHRLGGRIFLDLKLHDIPNTVGKTAAVLAEMGVFMFNVHASGGLDMMRQARDKAWEAADRAGLERPKIIAVTVLTSIDESALKSQLNVGVSVGKQVTSLATLAYEAGLDGVVSSPLEAEQIKMACGPDFLCVTPGVRPAWSAKGDQKRISTPAEAVRRGADYLVIGRAITDGPDPAENARRVIEEMKMELS